MLPIVLYLLQGLLLGLTAPLALGGLWLVAVNAKSIVSAHPQWPATAPPREAFVFLALCAAVTSVCLCFPWDPLTLIGATVGLVYLGNRRALPFWS